METKVSKIKWSQNKVLAVIKEARYAGRILANVKFMELERKGPAYAVQDGDTMVGTMLDVCGFASLKISARGKFFQTAKRLSSMQNGRSECFRFHCTNAYHGGGHLAIFDSSMRQEMSVNVAACEGQAEVLRKYGLKVRIESRID